MRKIKIATLTLLAAALVLSACAKKQKDSVYKVETFNGVPFITVDGKPVRNRIVWVAGIGTSPSKTHPLLSKSDTWNDWEFEFSAPNNVPAIVQLRMGESTGEVLFSKFDIAEAESGKIVRSIKFDSPQRDKNLAFWCKGFKENPPLEIKNDNIDGEAVLRVSMKADPKLDGLHLYTANIPVESGKKYKVALRAKASSPRPFSTSAFFYQNAFIPIACDVSTNISQIKHAANVGVNFVSFEINSVWTKPGEKPNFAYIDEIFRNILKANPNAKLLPRVRMDPQIFDWWRKSHPDDMMKNYDGSINEKYVSMSSPTYRSEAAKSLKLFIEYCEKNYPENMAGYHPAGANSREWFYGGTWNKIFSGYDANTLKAWRNWLQKKYSDMENLKKAWNDNSLESFDKIEIPSQPKREKIGYFINPKTAWEIADFNFFLQDEMLETVLTLAKTIREYAPRRLSIFFFGYGFEFSSVRNGPAFSGHYGLSKLIASDCIDAISGPISYIDRDFGDAKTTMGATESITDAGKLWIDEDDTSTYLAPRTGRDYPGKYSGLYNLEDSQQVLRRNLAQECVRNNGVWWMDLFGQGWFDDPKLWTVMKAFAKPERDIIKNPLPYRPQMRLVMDETSMCFVGAKGSPHLTTGQLMRIGRRTANRSGVPFGHYLLKDVLENPDAAKLNVMLSVYALNSSQRQALKKLREKSSNIWAWIPALADIDKKSFSLEAVKEATGFGVRYANGTDALAIPTEAGKKIGLTKPFGMKHDIHPLLSVVTEKGDIVLATYSDGSPCVVLRGGKHPQLFCGVTVIPTELYRYMAEVSGAHVYCRQDAAVYANGAYVSLTATKDGEHIVDFGGKAEIFDALSGKKLGDSNVLKINMKKGDCRFFRVGGGNAEIK